MHVAVGKTFSRFLPQTRDTDHPDKDQLLQKTVIRHLYTFYPLLQNVFSCLSYLKLLVAWKVEGMRGPGTQRHHLHPLHK